MTDITIDNVTTTFTDGAGIFDVLMRAIDSHLDKQYTSGRIKGPEYSQVYLASMNTALQQAIAFVLQEQEASKKIDLLAAQITNVEADTTLKGVQKLAVEAETIIKNNQSAKDLLVKQENIDSSQSATAIKQQLANSQSAVYTKQVTSYDNDHKYKVMKAALDIRSTGLTQGIKGITKEGGDSIIKDLLTSAGLTFNAYSGGSVPSTAAGFLVDPV